MKTLFTALIIAFSFVQTVYAQLNDNPFFVDAPGHLHARTTQDLSGDWRFMQDQLDNAIPNGQVDNAKQRYTFWMDDIQTNPGPLIEYDWDTQEQIKVPGDWNTQEAEYLFYEGTGWYQHNFVQTLNENKRYFLYFEASNYRTRAWINKQEVGATHFGGFTPFAYEVTDKLKEQDNSLVVSVNNERTIEGVPARSSDWWNYGGITRPVHIIEVPQTFIYRFDIGLSDRMSRTLSGSVQLDGKNAANAEVIIEIPGLAISKSVKTDSTGYADFSIKAPKSLALWSTVAPTLYEVVVKSGQDRVYEKVGFRTIETQGTEILLNGEPIFMAGISIHEEPIGPIGGRLVDKHQARALLQESKDLGANFVRLAHYPHTEWMLRLADEMGLLVWSELPVYWGIDFGNPDTLANAKAQMQANMLRDFNRASVVIWSVANETKSTPERNAFLESVIDHVRSIDNSRLVSAALLKDKLGENTIGVTDPLGQHLDIISVNEYEGWYGDRTLDDIKDIKWQVDYDKPLLFSEFGAGAQYGFHAQDHVRWSEEYQARFYQETIDMIEKIPSMRGLSPWILKDFKSHRRYHGRFQDFWNRKGLISETGEHKLAFDVLKRYYNEKLDKE